MGAVVAVLVDRPLYRLYRHGPTRLGCWAGADDDDVCAALSQAPASVWQRETLECQDMIQRDFTSRLVVVQVGVHAWCLHGTLSLLCAAARRACCPPRPGQIVVYPDSSQ